MLFKRMLEIIERKSSIPYNDESFDEISKAYDQAIDILEKSRWIPVTERLPNIATKCLVTLSNGYITIGEYFSIEKWTIIETSYGIVYPKESVIAWMPLPEPYTKEDDT